MVGELELPAQEEGKLEVHAVYRGQAMCGLLRTKDGQWPKGHDGVVYDRLSKITCVTCEALATTQVEQEAGA
jgi:hypothetical protein